MNVMKKLLTGIRWLKREFWDAPFVITWSDTINIEEN